MKKIYFILILLVAGTSFASAQGKSGKNKIKKEHHQETVYNNNEQGNDDRDDERGKSKQNNKNGKYSKNQPTKVTAAFQRDYPNATNVVWSKYRGDWTATFGNGIFRSTAVYHANGERRDTRTIIRRKNIQGDVSIWDQIFRKNQLQQNNIIQIEQPNSTNVIYRLMNAAGTALFFNQSGQQVNYNY